MPIVTTAIMTFIILIAIGIIVGLLFNRRGRSWLGRRSPMQRARATSPTA